MMDDTIKEQRFEQLCDCDPPERNDENKEQEPPNFQGGNSQSQYYVTIDVLDLIDINFARFTIGVRQRCLGRIRDPFLVRKQKAQFYEYYAQLSKEHDVYQVRRFQAHNQHGGHFYHMNLNRANTHDNADYGRKCCCEVLFEVIAIATSRMRTVNTRTVASSSIECIVASQHGIACYQPSFTVPSCNTDGGITVGCVKKAILNINTDKSHPFHEHFKSLYAKTISQLTMYHSANSLSNSTNLNILIDNQENQMLTIALVIIGIYHFCCYHVACYLFWFFGFCGCDMFLQFFFCDTCFNKL